MPNNTNARPLFPGQPSPRVSQFEPQPLLYHQRRPRIVARPLSASEKGQRTKLANQAARETDEAMASLVAQRAKNRKRRLSHDEYEDKWDALYLVRMSELTRKA